MALESQQSAPGLFTRLEERAVVRQEHTKECVGSGLTSHDGKDLVDELHVVRLVELRRHVAALKHDQQLQQ